MKKSLLTIVLGFFTLAASAQAKIELGIKAGANFANADAGSINTDGITSFHGGAYGLVKFANIGIQPEVLWSKQGNKLSGRGSTTEWDLTYVNVPVMLKFYLPLGLNFQVGPQFGILTNAENQDDKSLGDRFKKSDLSAALGAGWDLPFGLQLSGRYVLGLSDINDNLPDKEPVKNRTFQLSIGYSLFKLGN